MAKLLGLMLQLTPLDLWLDYWMVHLLVIQLGLLLDCLWQQLDFRRPVCWIV